MNIEALDLLKRIPFVAEGNVGFNASKWATHFDKSREIPESINRNYCRQDIFKLSSDKSIKTRFLCYAILAWGGMNRKHGMMFFEKYEDWISLANDIRNGNVKTRSEAYNSFKELRNNGSLPGMGPAYFTKLIFFLNPSLGGYIMDQWTSKSINLLFNQPIVDIPNGYVTDFNDGIIYEDFCKKIETISEHLGLKPIETEEHIFSKGGRKSGEWRKYVKKDENISKTFVRPQKSL